jgi:hypothetical protein
MVSCKECNDGGVDSKETSGLCDRCLSFHEGYDQAVREVLSEVHRCDSPLWRTIRRAVPLWGQLTKAR